ncbi:GntR family transcriptional regulator [Clostridium paraputrificum]|uniref:GntR family transcriptional regulator n=1 Tax=Clostridium TaxID=1485 RepID=UPI00189C6C9F|nr:MULTISPECIES: GntR family transcriptional regulator [Clostridium]MBS7132120.1 GntR family transcriptional regulator [Clostridium sp.]MDB2077118.1 GntR family transcriptional regulator [Clostridium paraputrificum]MDB2078911.1 GntR family transcriptional regulator [Clostridium paraputrificum]MDB2086704.1 GntR family transcriptional regulator [Clostridium paraputrificum]MDB2100400.1 GntR family transcriptional regulator [Clostridium paraputrificum]
MIDKSSPIPVYYQLKEDILKKIREGVWKVGQCIDSERELSENYGVSRMTIRQALGELVQEGILVREKGKGTFVCEPKVKQKDMMSFSEIIKRTGRTLETKVVEFNKIPTPEDLTDTFSFEEVYKINRNRIVDGECIANEIVYIPSDYCGFINEEKLKGSLYNILEEFGYSVEYSESSIKAVIMDETNKKIFGVEEQVPLLQINGKTINSDGKVLFVEEATYRSDKYILEVNILRREGKLK